MKIKHSKSYYVYQVFNTIILTLVTLSCIFPILHVFAMSLSDSTAAMAGRVTFFPVDFSLAAYEYLIKKIDFFHSVAISGGRVVIGTAFNMILIVLTAYPLARPTSQFRGRTAYMIYFAITMFLGGGLIPTYMVIKNLHLLNTFWVLVLPCAMNIWNVIIMMNFIRGLPRAVEEAAFVDGANRWTVLTRIVAPLVAPGMAITFILSWIFAWNEYLFAANLTSVKARTITTGLAEFVSVTGTNWGEMAAVSMVSILPALVFLVFVQRYIVTGLTFGAVKE